VKVAFLDRDGVINKEINYLHKIEDFSYTVNCISGLKKLNGLGFELIVVTNQAGLAKGIFSEKDFQTFSEWLLRDLASHGVELCDYIFCPHHPEGVIQRYSIDCDCRKPKPGMLTSARKKHKINMQDSILIGDKISDIQAAKRAGVGRSYLVASGHELNANDHLIAPVCTNLFEVAVLLENQSQFC